MYEWIYKVICKHPNFGYQTEACDILGRCIDSTVGQQLLAVLGHDTLEDSYESMDTAGNTGKQFQLQQKADRYLKNG